MLNAERKKMIRKIIADTVSVCFLSLLLFYVISITTVQYLLVIVVGLGTFLVAYGKKENGSYVKRILILVIGNGMAFVISQWIKGGEFINIMKWEVYVEAILILCEIAILTCIFKKEKKMKLREEQDLFPERQYDYERVKDFLGKVNILGINAKWGDGKSFLMESVCNDESIKKTFEIININLLTCRLGEVESNLVSEIDRVLQKHSILSESSKKLKKMFQSHSFTLLMEKLIWNQEDTVSASIKSLKRDVSKINKKLMIIFDDIDRVQNTEIVLNMFAISEMLASDHIIIVYQYDEKNLKLEHHFLEKYIPYTVNLTPMSYERIVEELWTKMNMQSTGVDVKEVKYLGKYNLYNASLCPELDRSIIPKTEWKHCSIRSVKIYLQEMKMYYEANPVFHEKDKKNILIRLLFVKNFFYELYEKIEIGRSITDVFRFSEQDKEYTIWDLKQKMKEDENPKDTWKRILASKENQEIYAILSFFPYRYRLFLEEIESEDILNQKENNEKIDRIIWNIVGNGHSEYTDMETFVRCIAKTVLNKETVKTRREAWKTFKEQAFDGKLWKNNGTLFKWMGDEYIPVFQAFKIVGAKEEQWKKWIQFYFEMVAKNGIKVEMIEALNYCDLTKKNIYICTLKEFNKCKILGNMNEEKQFSMFMNKYLAAISYLGYSRTYLFDPFLFEYNKECICAELPDTLKQMIKKIAEEKKEAHLNELKCEYDEIILFLQKCLEMIQSVKEVKRREIKYQTTTSTRQENEEEYQRLKMIKSEKPDIFIEELEKSYRNGKLNPNEAKMLSKDLD